MTKHEISQLIADFSACAVAGNDPELRVVEAALFVEESFGLHLSDPDFTEENLGTPEAIRMFVDSRLGA